MANDSATRRQFLGTAMAVSASPAAAPAAPAALPSVKFAGKDVTRLIIGSNPLYGYAHFNRLLSAFMKEYMTQDKRLEILHNCEKAGINTWQCNYSPDFVADWRRYRDEGGKMNVLVLGHGDMNKNYELIKDVARMGPLGIAHHGNITDNYFRDGEMDKIRDFVNRVKDCGVMAGISTHNPAVVDWVEGKSWEHDYYMTCVYRITRPREEIVEKMGEAPLGEPYWEKDPERMCKMIRATKRTCFAFKLLGAGRNIDSPKTVEAAFRYVLGNIKAGDAVIVGMCPRFKDEITENVQLVRRLG